MMKYFPDSLLCVTAAITAALVGTQASAEDKDVSAKVERGKYIVTTAGCHDCHTPFVNGPNGPEPDMSRMLSGHPGDMQLPPPPTLPAGPWTMVATETNTAYSGPWGISYTANLTPDKETGLGKWTSKTFMTTIRTGRHEGRGRMILPPMPIPVYKNFTDEDLAAIFAYLQSIPAIRNKVPEPVIAEEMAAAQ